MYFTMLNSGFDYNMNNGTDILLCYINALCMIFNYLWHLRISNLGNKNA